MVNRKNELKKLVVIKFTAINNYIVMKREQFIL